MRGHALIPLAAMLLAACQGNQGVSRFAGAGRVWELREMAGQPFTTRATIGFPEAGRITGKAPCNSYSARQNAPYPWFEASEIVTTKSAPLKARKGIDEPTASARQGAIAERRREMMSKEMARDRKALQKAAIWRTRLSGALAQAGGQRQQAACPFARALPRDGAARLR